MLPAQQDLKTLLSQVDHGNHQPHHKALLQQIELTYPLVTDQQHQYRQRGPYSCRTHRRPIQYIRCHTDNTGGQHANPGRHPDVPYEEVRHTVDFLREHLEGRAKREILDPLAS